MIKEKFLVNAQNGLHARLASKLVQQASSFSSASKLTYQNKQTDLKSIMGVVSLGVPNGAEVEVEIDGMDEVIALKAIELILKEK